MSSQQQKIFDPVAEQSRPDGSFDRRPSSFRNSIAKGGLSISPLRLLRLPMGYPDTDRPKLKGLEDIIGVSVVSPRLTPDSWAFAKVDPFPGADDDPLYGAAYLKELYHKANPEYEGRFTVPVLWDKKTETIVNNESSEIIRFFNTAFNHLLPADKAAMNIYPEPLRKEIDELNDWVYNTVNNGVYKAGFATTQKAYEDAVLPLFDSLDRLEKVLSGKDYLIGNQLTEADVRLFVTVIRFDVAYHGAFKCNLRTIRDGYPAIHLWLRKLFWSHAAFSETCRFDHIKGGYYFIKTLNPHGVIPAGPVPHILPL
ncbi:glutathione S-transferase [Ganoderma leucocontextum]|nr:glutathione S-transferase [Ganoderma leucocontextum]